MAKGNGACHTWDGTGGKLSFQGSRPFAPEGRSQLGGVRDSCSRTAIDISGAHVEAQFLNARHHLRGEGLIHLDALNV